jgi:hypothetical protein
MWVGSSRKDVQVFTEDTKWTHGGLCCLRETAREVSHPQGHTPKYCNVPGWCRCRRGHGDSVVHGCNARRLFLRGSGPSDTDTDPAVPSDGDLSGEGARGLDNQGADHATASRSEVTKSAAQAPWRPALPQYGVSSSGKSRLTVLDLAVQARDLRSSLVGMRVSNIYDIDSKTILLKLGGGAGYTEGEEGGSTARLSADDVQVSGESRRAMLVIESGVRIHTTKYENAVPPSPSGFVVKLRKHIRGRVLRELCLVGGDRLIQLTFGSSNWTHHVLVEFYAGGNVVLCDAASTILSVLRPYTASNGARVAAKEVYPLANYSSTSAHTMMRPHRLLPPTSRHSRAPTDPSAHPPPAPPLLAWVRMRGCILEEGMWG